MVYRPRSAEPAMLTKSLLTLALVLGSTSAHTIFQKVYVNGVDQGELVGIRAPDYDGVSILSLYSLYHHQSLTYRIISDGSLSQTSLRTILSVTEESIHSTNLSPKPSSPPLLDLLSLLRHVALLAHYPLL